MQTHMGPDRSLLLRLNGFGTRGDFHHVMGRGPQPYLLRMWLNAIESQREVLQSFRAHSDLLIRIQNLSNQKAIRSNKYLVSELRNSMARIFSILLFITCVYYLGRIPSPILTK